MPTFHENSLMNEEKALSPNKEHLDSTTESTLLEDDPPEVPLVQELSPSPCSPAVSRLDSQARSLTQALKAIAAVVAGFVFPGGGHFIQGRWGRGLALGLSVVGMFVCGLFWMAGHLYVPEKGEWLSFFPFLANVGLGGLYVLCLLLRVGLTVNADAPTYEYGNTFVLVAGLLNFLVILDAYDLAIGRKK